MIKPLGERVVIEVAESDVKTASGIVLPDTAKEKPQKGTVVAVGAGKLLDNGERAAMEVKVGDGVIFSKYSGSEVKVEGKDYPVSYTHLFLLSSEANLYALLDIPAKPVFNLSILSILGLSFFLIVYLGSGISRAKAIVAGLITASFLLSGSHPLAPALTGVHDATILFMGWLGFRGLVKSFRMGGESVDGVKLLKDTLRDAFVWLALDVYKRQRLV